MKKFSCVLIIISFIIAPSIYARPNWHTWVQQLRSEALSKGISSYNFDRIFRDLRPNPKLLRLDRNQPEQRLTYIKYRNSRGDAYRIKLGRNRLRKHSRLLHRIGKIYGVSPCFIVSLWGLESSYGHYMGTFNVVRSLATLAYDGRRSRFFRKELFLALRMVQDGHVRYPFKGEWAGASGQSQFLPSSFYRYAVDHDRDGRIDIWRSYPDIFASIANYLHKNNWQPGQPVLVHVKLPYHFDKSLASLKVTKPVYEWYRRGVRIAHGQRTPNENLKASILKPYGGPALMVFNNFKTIMTWNYSSYYAGTVNHVAQGICR
ncbi:MAG: lytic murein transglycosylase [Gammaproteobacteria bacterium]|nr:lytic murein transglycosylase [Gammaproteobacteria bacterium]